MAKLFLLRHIKSQWNEENRFTGWVDVPLAKDASNKAKELADKIFQLKIDRIYSSPLFRNEDTVSKLFDFSNEKYPVFVHLDGGKMENWSRFTSANRNEVPVFVTENLNERHYGKLQGVNKTEAMKKYGEDMIRLWRRSYKAAPPGGESLATVCKRTNLFYRRYVEKDLREGRNVLIVASHNSLRSIVKYIEKISDSDIINTEIPYAGLREYEFDNSLIIKNKKEL